MLERPGRGVPDQLAGPAQDLGDGTGRGKSTGPVGRGRGGRAGTAGLGGARPVGHAPPEGPGPWGWSQDQLVVLPGDWGDRGQRVVSQDQLVVEV